METYDLLKIGNIVTFNAGEKKIKAKIFDIYYFEKYKKYYCKEVEANDNIQRNS